MERSSRVKLMDPRSRQQTSFHAQIEQLQWISEFSLCFHQVSISKRSLQKRRGDCMTKPCEREGREKDDAFQCLYDETNGFTKPVPPSLLIECPETLRVVKAILGFTWDELAKLTGSEETTLLHVANRDKRITYRTAERYATALQKGLEQQSLFGRPEIVRILYQIGSRYIKPLNNGVYRAFTEESLIKLYEELTSITDHLQRFPDWLIAVNPGYLFVLRLTLGYTQKRMANLLHTKQSMVSAIERGGCWYTWKLRYRRHRLELTRILEGELRKKSLIDLPNKDILKRVLCNFRRYRAAQKGSFVFAKIASEQGKKAAYAREKSCIYDPFEQEVIQELAKAGIHCYLKLGEREKQVELTGEIHPCIEFECGERCYPDLAIPSGRDPKIIIDCRKASSLERSYLAKLLSPLNDRFLAMKITRPGTICVAVVKSETSPTKLVGLLRCADEIFTLQNLPALPWFIKKNLNNPSYLVKTITITKQRLSEISTTLTFPSPSILRGDAN
jgi:transcriptional regulator with XRE-family HTH domain